MHQRVLLKSGPTLREDLLKHSDSVIGFSRTMRMHSTWTGAADKAEVVTKATFEGQRRGFEDGGLESGSDKRSCNAHHPWGLSRSRTTFG